MVSAKKIRIANAPCSWGVIENTEGDRSGYKKVLEEMEQTGYAGTELGEIGHAIESPTGKPLAVLTREKGKNHKLRAKLEAAGVQCVELPLICHTKGPD